jgi:hypothetical protein
MASRLLRCTSVGAILLLGAWVMASHAHQDPGHRLQRVQVILDKSQRTEQYASADFPATQHVPTMIDAEHAMAHHQVMSIDGEAVTPGVVTSRRQPRRRMRRPC